ncbi:MAG: hypothetical protein ACOC3J_06405 [Gemmatimonadota bacterium]
MAGKLSPQAQMKVATLQAMADKVQHVYGLVERYAATRDPRQAEMLAMPMKRAFGKLKIELMGSGLDTLSQLAGSMEIAAGRGGSQRQKLRVLREGVASLRFQVEQEQKKVVSEDQAAQRMDEADAPPDRRND